MTYPGSGGSGDQEGRPKFGQQLAPNPEEVNEFHRYDDLGNSPEAHHHTLGSDPNQSSPGDHNHDGRNSSLISSAGSEGDSGWITPPYLNGWINYDVNHHPAQYRKIGSVVYLRGLVRGGAAGSAVFNLPVGFRPSVGPNTVDNNIHFASTGNGLFTITHINDSGNVHAGNSTWTDFIGITFIAEA